MTEHTRIAVPEERSLLERAAPRFEFAAPPVPRLPEATVAQPRATVVAPMVAALTASEAPRMAPLSFSGERHPIDRARLRVAGFIVPGEPVTALLEEFRLVKRQLMLTAAESRAGIGVPHGERILIASAHPGEGKTWVAVNLALAIAAEKDNEVLLVDADFAKPSVLSTLGLPGGPGLMDALADPALAVEDCVLGTDVPGLYVLPAGQTTHSDTEFLAAAHAARVLERLSAQSPSRLIIFDSPPVLAASPAAELASIVGQTLVVVRAESTGEAALKDALSLLSGCEDIKLLLNGVQFSPTGRRFGSYYGYGG
ncbi:MAG: AAA family ATPase [Novosphingobium sp.]|nr:AAA family ATPase [Novosphingobium sp.]